VISSVSTTVIVVSAALVGVVAIGTILGWLTERGRRIRRRLTMRIGGRPAAPRTHVHIEPDTRFCLWSQSPAPKGELKHVTFQMPCAATNLTPNHQVQLMGVELRGVPGTEVMGTIQVYRPGDVGVTDTLRIGNPERAMLIVVIERQALPAGPHRAQMVVRDHLGNRYRSPKVTFKDGNLGSPDGPPSPASTDAVVDHGGNG